MSVWDRFFRSRRVAREVRDEVRAHLDERVEDLIDAGVPEAEARRLAHVEFGSAARAVEDSRQVWTSRVLDLIARDLSGTWRGLRARGGRAWLSTALLAIALAANALVFIVVDALVLDRTPYPNVRTLVTFDRWLGAADLAEWRRESALFVSVDGWFTGTTFLLGTDRAEQRPVVSVTPGLFEALGVRPAWGRPLTNDDGLRVDEQPVLVSAALARRLFGSPDASLNQPIPTAALPLRVVGVMPEGFYFPSNGSEVWRALDPAGPLMRDRAGVSGIGRVREGVSFLALTSAVAQRGPIVASVLGTTQTVRYHVRPYGTSRGGLEQARLFYVLLGAATCLLLIACISVLNLELTATRGRVRTLAIRSALGASRAVLLRGVVLEGLALVGVSGAIAWLLTALGVRACDVIVPEAIRFSTAKAIGLDGRASAYILVMAVLAWMVAALPPAIYASRLDLSKPLKIDERSTSPRRFGTVLRRSVATAQVALAVLLVIVGGLYVRTYVRLLAQPKGFDSTGLASLSLALPNRLYPSAAGREQLANAIIDRLRAHPGVIDAIDGPTPPSTGNSPVVGIRMVIDGEVRESAVERPLGLAVTPVAPRYFPFLHVPLVAGRWLRASDDDTVALVGERFAEHFWPSADAAIGHIFDAVDDRGRRNLMWGRRPHRIVGVFADYRTDDREGPYVSRAPWQALDAFTARQPSAPPVVTPPEAELDTGSSYGMINVLVRLDSRARSDDVLASVHSVEPRLAMALEFVDGVYADRYRATLLATRVVGAFAVTSFVIALAGLYGVMALLVADRRREIGIRMALGADPVRIERLVFGSAFRLVVAGTIVGLAGAAAASRLIAAQLFQVSPTDPATYAIVAAIAITTALFATWEPARRAARIDPVETLRAE